jgi:2-oxo-3-(phosphooxy)propyl 3-oxoalkanoate synthase
MHVVAAVTGWLPAVPGYEYGEEEGDAMTARNETPPHRAAGHEAARYLIHRPSSVDHYLLDAPSVSEERFVLTSELPTGHPLFNDGPGHFHDTQVVTEAVCDIGAFVGHHYFGVPEDRVGLFHRFALDLTDPAQWRTDRGLLAPEDTPTMTTFLTALPTTAANGELRNLELRLDLRIDDAPCGRGTADMVFLRPSLYREHLSYSRALQGVPGAADKPDGMPLPAAASAVGRGRDENVVISEPSVDTRGRLACWLLTEGVSPVITGLRDELTELHLLEVLRQAALVAAGRTGGLNPARCAPAASEVQFRTRAGLDVPLRCVAVAGDRTHDGQGRPTVPVTLTVSQRRHAVAEAHVTVVQDL